MSILFYNIRVKKSSKKAQVVKVFAICGTFFENNHTISWKQKEERNMTQPCGGQTYGCCETACPCTGNNGFLVILVLFILLAIIGCFLF